MLYNYIFFQIDINALICISWLPFYCILSILCKHSLHRHFLAAICKLHATLVRTSYVFSLNQTVFDALIIKTRILWMMDALKARYFKTTSTVIRNINEITSPSVIFLLLLCKPLDQNTTGCLSTISNPRFSFKSLCRSIQQGQ